MCLYMFLAKGLKGLICVRYVWYNMVRWHRIAMFGLAWCVVVLHGVARLGLVVREQRDDRHGQQQKRVGDLPGPLLLSIGLVS